ncbi:MAG: response regulator transcription factor, partial [Candidatus Rokuibacteriota bacterium]
VHYALNAIRAGAQGYLVKDADAARLREAVRSVHQGHGYMDPSLVSQVMEHLNGPHRKAGDLDSLSPREFQLLRHLGSGLSLADCAGAMHVTESTAGTYRSRLMEKLGLTSTGDIIRFALEHGIVG